jgi:hypothetical protein
MLRLAIGRCGRRHAQLRLSTRRHSSTGAACALLSSLLENPELDRESAENELRWLQDAAQHGAPSGLSLDEMATRRGSGVPLQYVIGESASCYRRRKLSCLTPQPPR